MEITITNAPQEGKNIVLPENSIIALVGKNGSGKSKMLSSMKSQIPGAVFLSSNYENIPNIQTIDLEGTKRDQIQGSSPVNVPSLVASDQELLKIFIFFFKTLFNIELIKETSQFKTGQYQLNQEADGFKSLFNLVYYLISPHEIILLDEPERFFHPSLSSLFISLVSEIAQNYNKTIVLATHSSNLMRFDLENLYIYQIRNNPPEIVDINSWKTNLNASASKDKETFLDWFYFHANLVFAKSVLLVEGISDQIVLESIKNKLSYEFNLEDVVIKHVASSHHETGGKSRLCKMQSFLSSLCDTYCLADKDIIGSDLEKWYPWKATDPESKVHEDCINYKLFILKKGEIEDYYFIDPSFQYCNSASDAKKHKIAASYEQARIVSSKTFNEIANQYKDLVEMFKIITNQSEVLDETLKVLAKDYLIEKYIKKNVASEHLTDKETGKEIKIGFKFTNSIKELSYPKSELEKLKEIDIETNLK